MTAMPAFLTVPTKRPSWTRGASAAYAPDYIATAGGTIFDTDRIAQKGGFNRERAWANVSRIRELMTELIGVSKREKMPTWLAADRLASGGWRWRDSCG